MGNVANRSVLFAEGSAVVSASLLGTFDPLPGWAVAWALQCEKGVTDEVGAMFLSDVSCSVDERCSLPVTV